MTQLEKLIRKILEGKLVAFNEADKVLKMLGYIPENPGSSHVTYRKDSQNLITIVKRKELKFYEIKKIQEALKITGY
jgi:predicted RNA binding protein YcfA (HicA-like mRNA interferase family)